MNDRPQDRFLKQIPNDPWEDLRQSEAEARLMWDVRNVEPISEDEEPVLVDSKAYRMDLEQAHKAGFNEGWAKASVKLRREHDQAMSKGKMLIVGIFLAIAALWVLARVVRPRQPYAYPLTHAYSICLDTYSNR